MGAEAWAGAVTLMYTVMSICIRRNWATMRLGGTWTWTLLNNRILDKCVHPVTCNVTWNENKTWQCNQYGVVLIVIDQSILRIYKIIVLHINRKKNSRAQKLTMKDIIFAKSKFLKETESFSLNNNSNHRFIYGIDRLHLFLNHYWASQ